MPAHHALVNRILFFSHSLSTKTRVPWVRSANGKSNGSGTASAQLIKREGQTFLWSRGEDLITERFPEIIPTAHRFPDGTVLDGELLGWRDGVLPFADLQQRIGRKAIGKKILQDVPAAFMAFDLLERNGVDVRGQNLRQRRAWLADIVGHFPGPQKIILSPTLTVATWEELAKLRAESRSRHVEGLMLKHLGSAYGVGRQRGPWWKWKIDPYHIDAVLIYAEMGHGRRASLYTDYTFGLWENGTLVAFAKAYSGLTDEEIREVDRFVRQHTIEALRSRAPGHAGTRVRNCFREHSTLRPAQSRYCGAVPADFPLASRQKTRRRGYAEIIARDA